MKMNYLKIRADFKYATKGRFYRVFLVKEDIGLGELGELMVDIFGGTMEHFFMYHTKEKAYIPSSWMEQWDSFGSFRNEPFKDKTIKDLPEKFIFVYDTGDGWDFDCKIYKTIVTKEFEDDEDIPTGFVLDAKGMGIWEDNIRSLYAYLEGEIDKDFDGEDEKRGIYKPWNFDIKKYSQFDDPVDIEELNDKAMYFYPISEEERY
jgi:hypothetical protein